MTPNEPPAAPGTPTPESIGALSERASPAAMPITREFYTQGPAEPAEATFDEVEWEGLPRAHESLSELPPLPEVYTPIALESEPAEGYFGEVESEGLLPAPECLRELPANPEVYTPLTLEFDPAEGYFDEAEWEGSSPAHESLSEPLPLPSPEVYTPFAAESEPAEGYFDEVEGSLPAQECLEELPPSPEVCTPIALESGLAEGLFELIPSSPSERATNGSPTIVAAHALEYGERFPDSALVTSGNDAGTRIAARVHDLERSVTSMGERAMNDIGRLKQDIANGIRDALEDFEGAFQKGVHVCMPVTVSSLLINIFRARTLDHQSSPIRGGGILGPLPSVPRWNARRHTR